MKVWSNSGVILLPCKAWSGLLMLLLTLGKETMAQDAVPKDTVGRANDTRRKPLDESMAQETKYGLELYGFLMTDAGHNFNSMDPAWFDAMRPTKLPSYPGEYGPSGNMYFSVRQSRLGIRNIAPTKFGDLKTQIDIDLYGFGKDAGQTTFHVINAFAEVGKFLAGKTSSPFMPMDAVPVTLDYWGPPARVFNFNIQLRYTPLLTDRHRLAIAIEKPGATGDGGDYTNSIEIQQITPALRFPDLTAHFREIRDWGSWQISGLLKSIRWQNTLDSVMYDLSGKAVGWGLNFGTAIDVSPRIKIKAQLVYGNGIASYIADGPSDIGLQSENVGTSVPAKGKPLPVYGGYAFFELTLTSALFSTFGYSMETVENSDLQSPNDFKQLQYGVVNLRYSPMPKLMMGLEYQYGRRDNFRDGYHAVGNKLQFSCRFYYSSKG